MSEAKTSARRLLGAEKQAAAMKLRRAGGSYDAIAKQLGYVSRASAYNAVKRGLERTLAEPASELRTLEQDRLDALQLALWKKALEGEPEAVHAVLRVMERRARLLGLDVPIDIRVRLDDEQIDYMEGVVRRLLDAIEAALTSAGLGDAVTSVWGPVVLGQVVPRELAALAAGGGTA